MTRCIFGFAALMMLLGTGQAKAAIVHLTDIDSGTTSPSGDYRWLDVADQVYAESYRNSYGYTQAAVQVEYATPAATLHGMLTATNLKPNFAYQLKLVVGQSDPGFENVGFTGRWWHKTWNGSQWANGHNLNNKGHDLPSTTSKRIHSLCRWHAECAYSSSDLEEP